MDFLFLNHSASVEAIIVFLCLFTIFLFLLYDAIHWMRQKYRELHPRKTPVESIPVLPIQEASTEEKVEKTQEVPVAEEPEKISEENKEIEQVTGDSAEDTILPETFGASEQAVSIENNSSSDMHLDNEPSDEVPPVSEDGNTVSIDTNTSTREPDTVPPVSLEQDGNEASQVDAMAGVQEQQSEDPQEEKRQLAEGVKDDGESDSVKPKHDKKKSLSPAKKEKVTEIVNNAKTLVARGHIDDARSLIVNGLSLEKNNRELNLLMAGLYERDRAFEKAEFILKELAETDPEDTEVLQHLATVVAMQRKFEVSYELYKKILSLNGETEDTLYTLVHIAHELSLTEDVYNYAKSYLKQFPKNPDILWLYSQAQIAKADRKGAIETLIKLKNLTPYNQEIVDLISKLVTEDELAGNFGDNGNNSGK